ncbi:MAG TPA: hypothetical protein VGB19_10475 [Actinomycetota bacterium]
MRATPTTEALVSAFVLPGSTSEEVVREAIEGRLGLLVSIPMLAEFGRALQEGFGWDGPSAAEAVAQLVRIGVME